MNRYKYFLLLPIITILSCVCVILLNRPDNLPYQDLGLKLSSACQATSGDRQILITWDGLDKNQYDRINVEIFDNDELVYSESCPVVAGGVGFKDGKHGRLYRIDISAGTDSYSFDRVFLDYRKLPKLPIIDIQTTSGQDPEYSFAHNDGTVLGTTISDAEYIDASVCIYGIGNSTITENAQVKVRGNASNFSYNGKVSYRIKLNHKHTLIPRDQNAKSRQWVLLSVGNALNTYIGDRLTQMVGMECSNDMVFVNLMMNGDWKGCYCLTPAVTRSNMKSLVGNNGFLIENDAYFWNADGVYFKTSNSIDTMGYTFKYPEIADADDPKALDIQNYIQEFEDFLYSGNERYRDYIDEESFAKWLLVRDVMGEGDPVGANVYYYKFDFDPENPTTSKLKMGPVWDFDTMYGSGDEWCGNRLYGVTYFETLMMDEEFRDIYTDQWNKLKPELSEGIAAAFDELDGDELNKSWDIEECRWDYDIRSFDEQCEDALEWFDRRSEWIDKQLFIENASMGLLSESDFTIVENELESCIDSVEDSDDLKLIKGWAFLRNKQFTKDDMFVAVCDDNGVHIAGSLEREDVREKFGLDYNDPGFYLYIKDPVNYAVAIVDMQNRIMYK
ncbi:MAG: CotH kinase family protein [Lachnospiraceae bacterium]|nr:CotH kinase family protein [Lachnospiraceae bacterium]